MFGALKGWAQNLSVKFDQRSAQNHPWAWLLSVSTVQLRAFWCVGRRTGFLSWRADRLKDYVDLARELAEGDCLRLEDKQAISSSIVSVHALTILRHIDLIRRESAYR